MQRVQDIPCHESANTSREPLSLNRDVIDLPGTTDRKGFYGIRKGIRVSKLNYRDTIVHRETRNAQKVSPARG